MEISELGINGFRDIINDKYTIKSIDKPYPIWIIDDFLKSDVLDLIISNWISPDDSRWHNEYSTVDGERNLLEQGMKSISKIELMPQVISRIVSIFHSNEFTEYLSKLLDYPGLISDSSMRWSGMRTMIPNSFQLVHSDARKNKETGLRKELTCLLYLNKDYLRSRDQGCLEIWDDLMTRCQYEIKPIANRLVVFVNSDTSYHGVPNVKSYRSSITWSILSDKSTTDRYKALFVSRPYDSTDVASQGLKRSKI